MVKRLSHPVTMDAGPGEKGILRTLAYWSLAVTFLLTSLYLFTPAGKFFDLKATDYLIGNTTVAGVENDSVTVAIDDKSLAQYGQWPWPRYRLAMLIENIQRQGARAIAINMLFPEPDRTSPARWRETLHHKLGYSIDTSAVPEILLDHDKYLAKTLGESNVILGYELLFKPPQHGSSSCKPPPVQLQKTANTTTSISFYDAESILCNNEILNTAPSPSGFFNGTPDKDGILRRLPLVMGFKGQLYPSFAFQTFLQQASRTPVKIADGPLGITYISPGHIPVDRRGNLLINGHLKSLGKHISAVEVLSGGLDPSFLKDKVVFLGITASGLAQKYRLATTSSTSMVDIHKLTYQTLSGTKQYARGDLFWVVELLLALALTLLLVLSIAKYKTSVTCFVLAATVSSLGLSSFYISMKWGFIFSPLLPWSCLVINFFVLTTLKSHFSQKRSASEAGNALQLLETSQDTLQSILNTIPDIVFRLDSSGRIIFISSAVSRYKRIDTPLLGRSIFDLVAPEDQEKAKYKLNERRTGARATSDLEIRLRFNIDTPQGENEILYFSVSAAGLYQSDRSNADSFIGTQGIVKDITKRKKIEQQLLQAKKMEAIGNLAAGVAHDLNNILSGLVSYPEMILATIPKEDPLYGQISLIKKSGKKAAVIVQDLLTLARRNIHPQEVCDLNTIITDYLESTEHNQVMQGQANIHIKTNLLSPHANIVGSTVHISKAVMNLINNGIEAMVGGGTIAIATSKGLLTNTKNGYEDIPPGDYIFVTIQDSGIGIPQEDIPKIFEPFYTKKPVPNKGTGLGMTIIWATVKDHNGFIDIISAENKGTTITLYFPATEKKVRLVQDSKPLPKSIGGETILIVDDQEEQLIIGENILTKLGYSVITSKNGEDAIHILQKNDIDLVVLDMIMPDQLDGLDTFKRMLQYRADQKAIITSGYSESSRVKKMQQLGAGTYLQKPYSMEDFAKAVRKELDR